jgi:hypothetical protein
MVTAAVRFPVAVGVNVTVIVQLAPAAILLPQVLVSAKSPAFVPVMLIAVKFNWAVSIFVKVTVFGGLVVPTGTFPKARDFVDKLTKVPVPLRATACGLAGSESLMASTAFLKFFAVGVNVTEIVQLALGGNDAPQVLVSA